MEAGQNWAEEAGQNQGRPRDFGGPDMMEAQAGGEAQARRPMQQVGPGDPMGIPMTLKIDLGGVLPVNHLGRCCELVKIPAHA